MSYAACRGFESLWGHMEEEDDTFDVEAWKAELESPAFLHGLDVGKSFGWNYAWEEAQRAFDMGEIELWLAYYKPKTIEGWREWEAEHGKNFKDRWKREAQN